ncbi:cell division protein FtsQ/DivIB [Paenibacillus sp. 2TAB19]|uniref:cell division protein FtsQ/DivIB n=1 Tax=Paenibacillus sp. 2TAB19 TaxID=3233003 RepID=UPI003F9CB8D8
MSENMPVLKEPAKKRRGSRKLLIVLFLLFLVLLAVLFFNSSISKIEEVQIVGTKLATNAEVAGAAAVAAGDAFFGTTSSTIEKRVEKLPQVEQATVNKVFPGVVQITVQEYPIVAFELSPKGELTALLSNGTSIASKIEAMLVADKPVLTGWAAKDKVKVSLMKQLGKIPVKQLSDLSEIIPDPSKAYPDRIKIYTRTKFEVITSVAVLPEKIEALNAVIETQEPGRITMLLADTYVPFNLGDLDDEETDSE